MILKKAFGKDSTLIKAGAIFFIASVLGAALNYLYHLIIGRMLGPEKYGVLGSLFAIIYFITFFSATFNVVISKFSSHFSGKSEIRRLKHLIIGAAGKIALYGSLLLVIYILFSPQIAHFMNISDINGIIIVGVMAYFSVIFSILIGALNGMQRFVWQNISSFSAVFLKFSLGVFFVYIGFGVLGALAAVLIGIVVGIMVAIIPLFLMLRKIKAEKFDSKSLYLFALPVFISSSLLSFMITIDVFLVKHFFSSADAGHYAAAGMVAKIIWFGSGFFASPIFPMIVELKAKKKDPSKILRKALAYTAIIAAIGITAYYAAPILIVSTLYGAEYLAIAEYIWIFGFALGIYSIINVLVLYNLAIEKYKYIFILFIAAIIECTGIYLFHSELIDVVKIVLAANIFLLLGLLFINRKDIGVKIAQ
ncbi:MAG: oligosaccharide flippase family protein [archaeon]